MFLSTNSPYNLSELVQAEDGKISFALRDRLLWEDLANVRTHVVKEGETLQYLAWRYYGAQGGEKGDGARLWWAIADFQPEPINDPTVALTPGQIILIPPLLAIQTALTGGAGEYLTEAE